jgi:hypothetical protein
VTQSKGLIFSHTLQQGNSLTLELGVNSRLVFVTIGSPSSPLRSVSELSTQMGEVHYVDQTGSSPGCRRQT